MVARKSHPKSRNGCPQCKKRRIKCDEVKPRCSNCAKHDIECGFATDPPQPGGSPVSTKRRRSSDAQPGLKSLLEKPAVKKANPNGEACLSGKYLQPLQMDELELLHHFTTETCNTLSDRPESHDLWRIVVPQIAFEHEYLMRGILAISALHLSNLRPQKHDYYARIAVQQQDAALSSFRVIMTSINESVCDAFFGMSSLIVVYGFESPRASKTLGMFEYNGEHTDEWLPLIRGVNSVLQSCWPSIKKGRLSGLLHDHAQSPPSTELPEPLDEQLRNLDEFGTTGPSSDQDKEACRAAIIHLRQCFMRIYNKTATECEISLAFLWPVMIPQHFIAMIFQRKPEALIILAYYCTILHHLNGYWWLEGWGRHIIENIQLELKDRLQEWIDWPARVVGLPNIFDSGDAHRATLKTPLSAQIEEKSQQQITSLMGDIKEMNGSKAH